MPIEIEGGVVHPLQYQTESLDIPSSDDQRSLLERKAYQFNGGRISLLSPTMDNTQESPVKGSENQNSFTQSKSTDPTEWIREYELLNDLPKTIKDFRAALRAAFDAGQRSNYKALQEAQAIKRLKEVVNRENTSDFYKVDPEQGAYLFENAVRERSTQPLTGADIGIQQTLIMLLNNPEASPRMLSYVKEAQHAINRSILRSKQEEAALALLDKGHPIPIDMTTYPTSPMINLTKISESPHLDAMRKAEIDRYQQKVDDYIAKKEAEEKAKKEKDKSHIAA